MLWLHRWSLYIVCSLLVTKHSSLGDDNVSCDTCDTVNIKTSGAPSLHFIDPNLHPEHYPFYFNRHSNESEACQRDSKCKYKKALNSSACWGYEDGCNRNNIPNPGWPLCTEFDKRWAPTFAEFRDLFWKGADFGYVAEMRKGMKSICSPSAGKASSSLDCTTFMRHCKGQNILLNFTGHDFHQKNGKFSTDEFKEPGIMGGNCYVDKEYLASQNGHYSEVQSWYGELQSFAEFNFTVNERDCDVVLDKPTYFMKLDAGINMYHHFCDFVNLYISQHINNSFSTDVFIVNWQMGVYHYGDFFEETWQSFTDYPIKNLHDFGGQRVCVKNAIFSLPPRMRLGFYYNMPIVPHCSGSSLIRAFSQHVLHRLDIKQVPPMRGKVRITILARNSKHRNIINQDELMEALQQNKNYEVKVVVYDWRHMSFKEQLKITRNSDVFISMHGAGLTHGFFLPDWGVLFELHNCEDENCYKDLARLRGIKYITWENNSLYKKHNETLHPSLKVPHSKFCDYSFDVDEFVRLVKNAAYHVKTHAVYRKNTVHDEL